MLDRFFNNGTNGDDLRLRQYRILRELSRQTATPLFPPYTSEPIPIPYEAEEDMIHDGKKPCGRPGCPCEHGYR